MLMCRASLVELYLSRVLGMAAGSPACEQPASARLSAGRMCVMDAALWLDSMQEISI